MSIFNWPLYSRASLGDIKTEAVNKEPINNLSTFYTPIDAVQSTKVLQAGPRRYLSLKNLDSGSIIYVGVGESADIDAPTNIRLMPNDEKVFDQFIPEEDLFAIANVGTPNLSISVGVK